MNSTRFRLLYEIFLTFAKISPITFGGGFAMIPVLEAEIVQKKKWVDSKKIADVLVVAQSVPGAIAVNSATFLGYQVGGTAGAIAAILGIVLPTFIIIIALAVLFVSFHSNIYILAALKGIRPVIVALIATAAYKMYKVSLVDKTCCGIFAACTAVLVIFKNVNLILIILSGALLGIVFDSLKKANGKNGGDASRQEGKID